MKTIYVVNKKNEIIGEVTHIPQIHNIMYFYHSIAHSFGVDISQLKTVVNGTYDLISVVNNITKCKVCEDVAVDILGGYDTCPDCMAIQKPKSGWTLEGREDFINKTKHLK